MAKQIEQKESKAEWDCEEKNVEYLECAKKLEEVLVLQNILDRIDGLQLWDEQRLERVKQLIEMGKTTLNDFGQVSRLNKEYEVYEELRIVRVSIHKAIEFQSRLEVERKKLLKQHEDERERERRIRYKQEKMDEEKKKIAEDKTLPSDVVEKKAVVVQKERDNQKWNINVRSRQQKEQSFEGDGGNVHSKADDSDFRGK